MLQKLKIKLRNKIYWRLFIGFSVFVTIFLIVVVMRIVDAILLKSNTEAEASTIVQVIAVQKGPVDDKIILPGNVQAWHEATVYARTNGYIKKWYVDIGSRVKAGDLLAEIETPEIDAQLRQAEADLKTAIANYRIAKISAIRWLNLLKTESVSKQETDERVAAQQSTLALVHAAQANRDRLKELVSFKKVTAPFAGIITFRYIDIGSLINAGSNTTAPLFHIVQADPLRVYVSIPQYYVARVTPNLTVDLYFPQHPNNLYPAKLLETAQAIDPNSRTLLAQFVANNKDYALLPGAYTEVHFKLDVPKEAVRLPVNTLVFRAQGLQVATVDNTNHVLLKKISINRDFGTSVEINAGVQVGEKVILNPPDSVFTGEKVRIAKDKNEHVKS